MQIFGLIILRSTQSLVSFHEHPDQWIPPLTGRHGITLWTWYSGIKTILLVFFENADALLSGIPVNGLHIFFILTTAVASYAVLYYTWKGDFLQIGCVALLSDIFCGSAFIIASAMVNIVSGYTPVANLIGKDPVVGWSLSHHRSAAPFSSPSPPGQTVSAPAWPIQFQAETGWLLLGHPADLFAFSFADHRYRYLHDLSSGLSGGDGRFDV